MRSVYFNTLFLFSISFSYIFFLCAVEHRLRKVKMDQRKLMDNANTITDMAKVKECIVKSHRKMFQFFVNSKQGSFCFSSRENSTISLHFYVFSHPVFMDPVMFSYSFSPIFSDTKYCLWNCIGYVDKTGCSRRTSYKSRR